MFAAAVGIIGLVLIQYSPFDQISHLWWEEDPDWRLYKTLFISNDGRVIDTGNQYSSHSEGQGWGMLFAVKNNDQSSFDQLWRWTRENLQIRQDPLFVWRWDANQSDNHTPDTNNASDGDLYIAWSLLRAGRRWSNAEYTNAAKEILKYIREKMIRHYAGMTILLPGEKGFEREDYLLLNLSYWIFPAFNAFDQIDPSPVWHELHESGIKLINEAQFGQWKLPSDWIKLTITGEVKLSEDFPPRFSYDAIRVPLLLLWGQVANQKLLKPYKKLSEHFSKPGTAPAWIDLKNGSVAPYQASEGFYGVMTLAKAIFSDPKTDLTIPNLRKGQDYYDASLLMLAHQAVAETKKND